jgi:hypothetical protein
VITDYLKEAGIKEGRIFPVSDRVVEKGFLRISEKSGIKITPKKLRSWFSTQLADLGVPDRYVDVLTGHTPKSILAKHYTDYNPTKLREIYEKAGISVFGEAKAKQEIATGPKEIAAHRIAEYEYSKYEMDKKGELHKRTPWN